MVFVLSTYLLVRDFFEYKESKEANSKLIENVIIENNDKEKIEINWEELESINKDIIGWIRITDTNINYPILKDNEQLKYLKHSYDGKYNSNGSIFTLNQNAFEDNVTTIYAHNMKSGLMFSDLGKYMNKEFFDKHSIIEIFTKTQNYKATIFSCYSIDIYKEENNINLLDFDEEVEYYKNMSKIKIENIGKIKKIIKLSTCSYLNSSTTPTHQRYFVIAKIEKVE